MLDIIWCTAFNAQNAANLHCIIYVQNLFYVQSPNVLNLLPLIGSIYASCVCVCTFRSQRAPCDICGAANSHKSDACRCNESADLLRALEIIGTIVNALLACTVLPVFERPSGETTVLHT